VLRRFVLTGSLLLLAIVVAACSGTPGVSGRVTINGEAPGDVNVEIVALESSQATAANKNGAYALELDPGSYTIEAKIEGLPTQQMSVNMEEGDQVKADFDFEYTAALPFVSDFSDPLHHFALQRTWSTLRYDIRVDPFGDMAVLFPQGDDTQAPPSGYQLMRFALLNTDPVDEFKLSVDQLGVGGERPPQANPNVSGGNRSLSIVFGYEDVENWWVIYYTYTNTTSVRRMKDGQQQYVCRPMDLEQWMPSNDAYQTAEVQLVREGDNMVVRASANGEPISIDGCTFPAEDYTPGKIGLGGHSTSDLQSWFLKNIELEAL